MAAEVEQEQEEDLCVVCLEPLDAVTTFALPCGHRLHEACIAKIKQHHHERILAGVPQCPLCRSPMPMSPSDEARAAVTAYRSLSSQITQAVENGTIPVTQAQQMAILQQSAVTMQTAADIGNADALCNLGVYYSLGIGVARDEANALEFSLAAADMGHAVAQSNIAHMFATGNNGTTDRDYTRALHYWTLAANQNNTDAMYNTGVLHRFGLGTPVDLATARGWFTRAAEHGHQQAAQELLDGDSAAGGGVPGSEQPAVVTADEELLEAATPAEEAATPAEEAAAGAAEHPEEGGSVQSPEGATSSFSSFDCAIL